jgi:di/tricarboxylate transporter
MTLPVIFVLALFIVASVLLVSGRLRPDLVALLVLVVLGLSSLLPPLAGIVKPQELFSGFSRDVVITILSLSIITHALERVGATRQLGQFLLRLSGESESRAVLVVMVAAALLSLVMNNIAAAAMLLPAVIGLTRQTGMRPSRLLMPLAFGTMLGGTATLLTTANLLVSAALVEQGVRPYGLFEFAPVGVPIAIAGIGFVTLVGRRWLPDRGLERPSESRHAAGSLSDTYGLRQAVCAVYVRAGSAMAGLSLAAGHWGEQLKMHVVGIVRSGSVNLAPPPDVEVREGDVVLCTGNVSDDLLARYGLVFTDETIWQGPLTSEEVNLMEVTLAPRSALAGKTLREINFREKFNLSVIAIWRESRTLSQDLAEIPLRFGDALLIQGRRSRLKLLRSEKDFLVLEEDAAEMGGRGMPRRSWLALGLTVIALLLAALDVVPIAQSTFAAACLLVLFNCLSMDEAYSAIEWKIIFLIAGMLPLGIAMTNTGAAALVGQAVVAALGQWGPLAVAGGLFVVTVLLTQVIGGQVTPVILAPIAIAAAQHIGADPRGMGMAVAIGASMAFLSPLSHSVNMLVMGPGGYTFRDYSRVGLPLIVVLSAVMLAGLALFWGIR